MAKTKPGKQPPQGEQIDLTAEEQDDVDAAWDGLREKWRAEKEASKAAPDAEKEPAPPAE